MKIRQARKIAYYHRWGSHSFTQILRANDVICKRSHNFLKKFNKKMDKGEFYTVPRLNWLKND